MPRRAAQVTQADIARAARALRDVGYQNVRVVMREGRVIVEPVPEQDDRREPDRDVVDDGALVVL